MPTRPKAVAFDVLETLFPLEPMRLALAKVGLVGESLEVWFGRTLRDGFALSAAGDFKPFKQVAAAELTVMLRGVGGAGDDSTVEGALGAMSKLSAAPDVEPAFAMVREAGVPILAVSNGSAESTRKLLENGGLAKFVAHVVSIDDVARWKPAREVYLRAAEVAGVGPGELALVAAHAWDCQGAKHAGLKAAWVKRQEKADLPTAAPPDVYARTLVQACKALIG